MRIRKLAHAQSHVFETILCLHSSRHRQLPNRRGQGAVGGFADGGRRGYNQTKSGRVSNLSPMVLHLLRYLRARLFPGGYDTRSWGLGLGGIQPLLHPW